MNINEIKFSIILPFYNASKYIKASVDSVCKQTYDNFELIAVNDGSNDDSAVILKSTFKPKINKLKLIEKENGGYVSAVNEALKYVEGTYFLFLGSDDELDIHLLENIVNNIKDVLPDFIGFNTLKVKQTHSEIENSTKINDVIFSSNTSIDIFSNLFKRESQIFSVRDTSKCFKTELVGTQKYFGKYGYDADGIFSMLYGRKCSSFMCLPIVGYHWTLRDDSLSGREATDVINLDRIKNWTKFYQIICSQHSLFSTYEISYLCHFKYLVMLCSQQSNLLLIKNKHSFIEAKKILMFLNTQYSFMNKKEFEFPLFAKIK